MTKQLVIRTFDIGSANVAGVRRFTQSGSSYHALYGHFLCDGPVVGFGGRLAVLKYGYFSDTAVDSQIFPCGTAPVTPYAQEYHLPPSARHARVGLDLLVDFLSRIHYSGPNLVTVTVTG